jgi:hypothetical protein
MSLAHANKLIKQRNEGLADTAVLAGSYFDGENREAKVEGFDSRQLQEYKDKLFRTRDKVELHEWTAANRRLDLKQLERLVESLRPAFTSIKVTEDGTVYFIRDLFSESIEGIEGAAFRIRECLRCSTIFWAKNNKTVVCSEHFKMRRNERSNLGTKKNRQSGRIDSKR